MPAARRFAALATLAAVTAGACGSSSPVVKLDGSPRTPDAEGVVHRASINGITLDGNRRYAVSKKLISFSTYNQEVVPLSTTVGTYVQVGIRSGTVVWLAKVGVVSGASDGTATVQYQGKLVRVSGRKLIFKDGTVLTLASGLEMPSRPEGPTFAVIDAKRHVVQGATFAPRTQK